ncbi:MAG: YbgC/FadM family acyl-CoA thioesterase [Micromonosporaceae bacterium]|nr:YbgC/FadM family acyl-CoA thioesterase [Micromonosporaceae bacterium]
MSYKVYYEDTDCLGIVYYANYLRFLERGRSEFIAAHGQSVADWNREGYLLVVRSLTIAYRRAAVLGDLLDVVSSFTLESRFRAVFHQRVERAGELIVEADVEVICLDPDQKPIMIPEAIQKLAAG